MLAAMLMPKDKLLRWPPLKVSSFCYLFRDTEELPTKPLLLLANWSMLNSPFGSCQTRELVEYTHIFCIMMESYSSCKHRGLLELNITIWLPCFGSEKTKKQSQYFLFLIFNIFFYIYLFMALSFLFTHLIIVKSDNSESIHFSSDIWGKISWPF